MKKILSLFLFCLITFVAAAQKERNYIYLLDCTQSMITPNQIWDETKKYLRDDIQNLSPECEVNVIPFQGNPYPNIKFVRKDFSDKKWNEIEKTIDGYIQNKTSTNICDTWDSAMKFIDPLKDNYFFLLTDGEDNIKGMDEVCRRIKEWCSKYSDGTYGFYVMLCEKARSKKLREAVANCTSFFLYDANGHPIPIGLFKPHDIRVSTRDLDERRTLTFSFTDNVAVKTECSDPLFTVQIKDGRIKEGQAIVQVQPRKDMKEIHQDLEGQEVYSFQVKLIPDKVRLIGDILNVEVINKPIRSLSMVDVEQNMGKATYYNAFLFWGEKSQDTLHVDLEALYNEEARTTNANVTMQCSLVDGDPGFAMLYNGKLCTDNTFDINNSTKGSVLSLVFDKNAKAGKRHIMIKPIKISGLELINGNDADDYSLTLRARYGTKWNPLKVILLWVLGLILLALVLWFVCLRQIVYPRFKVKKLYIAEPLVRNIKLRGTRKVVFSNKEQKQSLLNKIFTGTICFMTHEIWKDEWEIVPSGKTVRLSGTKNRYLVDPPSSRLTKGEEYTLTDEDKNKTVLTIS